MFGFGSKREEYHEKLEELDEAYVSGSLYDGDDVYLLRTPQGWQRYEQECDKLKELATQVIIEEA
jgi:hypothetical protein